MLGLAKVVHEALGIESTIPFVLAFVLIFGGLGGGAAFLIDRPYKKARTAEATDRTRRNEIRHSLNQFLLEGGGYQMAFPWLFRPTVEQGTGRRVGNDPDKIGAELLRIGDWHFRAVMFAQNHLGETYVSRLMLKNRSLTYPFGMAGNDIYERAWDTVTATNQTLTDFIKELPN